MECATFKKQSKVVRIKTDLCHKSLSRILLNKAASFLDEHIGISRNRTECLIEINLD